MINNRYIKFVEYQINYLKPLNDPFFKKEALENFKL